jgi:hypothetical protein
MAYWRSAIEAWRKFRRLPGPDRLLFVQALAMVSLTGLALRCLGFRRWHATLARLTPAAPPRRTHDPSQLVREARRLTALLHVACLRAPSTPTCLHRSLTLWWLLRRRGLASDLRIGVRKAGNRLEAHAWVESQNRVLNDRDDVHLTYTPFDRAIEPRGA